MICHPHSLFVFCAVDVCCLLCLIQFCLRAALCVVAVSLCVLFSALSGVRAVYSFSCFCFFVFLGVFLRVAFMLLRVLLVGVFAFVFKHACD